MIMNAPIAHENKVIQKQVLKWLKNVIAVDESNRAARSATMILAVVVVFDSESMSTLA